MKPVDKKTLTEKLDTLADLYSSMSKILPNPNSLIKQHGHKVFSETFADGTVRSCINAIFDGVASLEYEIIKNNASDKEAVLAEETIELWFKDDIAKKILRAYFLGSQFINTIWDLTDYWKINELVEIPHDSVVYDNNRKARILTAENRFDGIEPEPYQMLVANYDTNYSNPYGVGLFLNCYKYVFIKNNVLDFWSVFTEDFGSPSISGTYTQSLVASTGFKDADTFSTDFLDKLSKMRTGKVILAPAGSEISVLPSGTISSAEIYSKLVTFCNEEITKILLGHNSVNTSTPGKLGNENMAEGAKIDKIEAYTSFLTQHINELLKWQHELNFPGEEYCKIRFFEKDDFATISGKLDNAVKLQSLGVQLNEDYYEKELNLDKKYFTLNIPKEISAPDSAETPKEQTTDTEEKPVETTEQNLQQRAKFFDLLKIRMSSKNNDEIEKDLKLIEDLGDDLLDSKEWQDLKTSLYSDIQNELKQYDNYDDMLANIYDIYPKINYKEKVKYLTKLILISNIYGKYTGDLDDGRTD